MFLVSGVKSSLMNLIYRWAGTVLHLLLLKFSMSKAKPISFDRIWTETGSTFLRWWLFAFIKANNNGRQADGRRKSLTEQKLDGISVTSKMSPNVFKSYPKMILLEKWKFYKIYQKCGQFGQINCCLRLWKVAKSAINYSIWSRWTG